MEIHNPQMLRILKFVAEMKKNKFPNAGSFAKLLHETDINENTPCCRSERTIMRDIAVLRKDFIKRLKYLDEAEVMVQKYKKYQHLLEDYEKFLNEDGKI